MRGSVGIRSSRCSPSIVRFPAAERPRTDASKRDQWLTRYWPRRGQFIRPLSKPGACRQSPAARRALKDLPVLDAGGVHGEKLGINRPRAEPRRPRSCPGCVRKVAGYGWPGLVANECALGAWVRIPRLPLAWPLKTPEPDGQATGCNPVEVGSTPTGVSRAMGPSLVMNIGQINLIRN